MPDAYDVICIGAGPTGLACAIEAKRAGSSLTKAACAIRSTTIPST
jgi:thioredoxin reductase